MAVLCRNLSSNTANTEFMGTTPLKFYRENIIVMRVLSDFSNLNFLGFCKDEIFRMAIL